MFKILLISSAVLAVIVRAQLENEISEIALKRFVEAYRKEIIDKKSLTCENYIEYCEGEGAHGFETTTTCQIWNNALLCKHVQNIEDLKNTVKEMKDASSVP